jgi:hypothetical protein
MDLKVILPREADFPIDTMPEIMVANTNGAIIILIKRKKISVMILNKKRFA